MRRIRMMLLIFMLLVALTGLAACGNASQDTTAEIAESAAASPESETADSAETEVQAQADVPKIRIIPESYDSPATHQGTVEAFSYDVSGTEKTAYVYLPYGYEDDGETRYNILYFMHGGGGSADQFYNRSYALNDILDHAIENGEIEPLIVVTPTFYPPGDTDHSVSNAAELVSVFHTEFINDLMPSVESHYRTYAEEADAEGLEASRKHRAFGGFSMGSVTTWYQFVNALDYVAYFMPLSGDCWEYGNQGGASHPKETAEYLGDFVVGHRYADDFYIYAMTGGDDIAYDAMTNQINALHETDGFKFGEDENSGNISFQILDGATHDYTYYRNYIYSILPYFFGNGSDGMKTVEIKAVRMTIGDTTGYVALNDNETAQAFLDMMPLTMQMNDLHGREYWFSHSMPYDEQDVVHDYAPGHFTYWCGGWVTAYYDRDDDDVIEDGSVVIGIMDDVLIEKFSSLNGESVDVFFDTSDR